MESPSTSVAASAVNLSKIYGSGDSEVRALDNVSVDFATGEFTAIMGPSGSGKSTLMHCIAGLDELTSGSALIDGEDLSTMSDKELTTLRREKIGFIFQSFNLVPTLTAEENILLPLLLGNTEPNKAWVDRVIDTVHLRNRLSHRPSELSGGQQQRVSIARAFVNHPPLLICDEPTGNLDPETSIGIMQLLYRINRAGTTILMATHDREMVDKMRRRVIALEEGRVARDDRRGGYVEEDEA